jgi:ferredoxin-NADP reductase
MESTIPAKTIPPLPYTARLVCSPLLSERTKHLEFEVEGVERFDFKPGQFVSVKEPRPDGKVTIRAYSIASAPAGTARFSLCVNRVDDGFMSNYLCDLQENSQVRLQGPYGALTLRPEPADVMMIATGTGVAPFRAMVEWLFGEETPGGAEAAGASRHGGKEYWLVYGTRYEEDVFYKQEFEAIAARHPNFHYLVTLSRPAEGWTGWSGHVQEHVRRLAGHYEAAGRKELTAYICGLGEMVTETRDLLRNEMGWERQRVIIERYS